MSAEYNMQYLTLPQWIANVAAAGASEDPDAWANRKRRFLDGIETSLDQTRADIRSSVLDSMLRTDEEEH